MMILSVIGLVVLVALVAVGGAWVVKNVNFKQTEDKEDTK
jgi:hypothetical protein